MILYEALKDIRNGKEFILDRGKKDEVIFVDNDWTHSKFKIRPLFGNKKTYELKNEDITYELLFETDVIPIERMDTVVYSVGTVFNWKDTISTGTAIFCRVSNREYNFIVLGNDIDAGLRMFATNFETKKMNYISILEIKELEKRYNYELTPA